MAPAGADPGAGSRRRGRRPIEQSILASQPVWLASAILLLLAGAVVLALHLGRRRSPPERLLASLSRDRDLVLRSISDNVTLLDRELRIVWTNWADRPADRFLGRPTAGAVCHLAVAGRQRPCAGCPVPGVLHSGEATEGEVVCRDGRVLRMSAAPVRDGRGQLVGVVQTSRDITEKRRLAERLHQSQKLEAVGQLAAGVAHDFNNSLQAVLGYADLLASLTPADGQAQHYVRAMNRAGQQAREVVRQLLTFSRKREPRIEAADLGAWLQDQAPILRRLLGPRIEVRLAAPAGLPPVPVDVAQVEQALLNLCTNARDAMPDGGRLDLALETVDLSVDAARRRGAPAPGRYVVLSVADQGVGIAPELQERIFDPFFTTKDVDRGNGLGLASVYGIVAAHRGFLELQSAPGRGATFRLGWPIARPPDAAPDRRDASGDVLGRSGRTGRILVVDREEPVRRFAVAALRRAGHRVDEAADGADALARLADPEHGYDLVVLDLLLDGLNGWSLYRQARRQAPGLKALFCSSHDLDLPDLEQPAAVSQLAYLRKPFRAEQLVDGVAELLGAAVGDAPS